MTKRFKRISFFQDKVIPEKIKKELGEKNLVNYIAEQTSLSDSPEETQNYYINKVREIRKYYNPSHELMLFLLSTNGKKSIKNVVKDIIIKEDPVGEYNLVETLRFLRKN